MKIQVLISCVILLFTIIDARNALTRVKRKDISKPIVDKLHIRSDIQLRYSKTVVESHVRNPSDTTQEVAFEMVLPEKAFITNFTIESRGKEYVSRVVKKEIAYEMYEKALNTGQTAGLVDAREGNVFSIWTNVAAAEKMTFTLTYEQLLQRRLSKYEQVINLNPGQLVEDLLIEISIKESLPVVDVNVPELKQKSTDLLENLAENPVATINYDRENSNVYIKYEPSIEEQMDQDEDGVHGQFIVQYDVDRKAQRSDIQVYDGYMVHFFVPENLEVMPKHVTFVLDTSGSMHGQKITQLQDAMVAILSQLKPQDYFSIIEFNSKIKPWVSLADQKEWNSIQRKYRYYYRPWSRYPKRPPPLPKKATQMYQANKELVKQAIDYVVGLKASGMTNINDALLEAVKVAGKARKKLIPIIMFLTDGRPTSGVTNRKTIVHNVKRSNKAGIPIYALAFGAGADFKLLKELSANCNAFARKIFEGSDATIQLENFYAEISSPLLRNVNFEYVGENLEAVENFLPDTIFNTGSEFISVVKLSGNKLPDSLRVSGVSVNKNFEDIIRPCILRSGVIVKTDHQATKLSHWPCIPPIPPKPPLPPKKKRTANFIERLYAFLTIQKLLDDQADNGNTALEERNKEATEIALKYNFVTDLTSLVVVKPTKSHNAPLMSLAKLTPVQPGNNGKRKAMQLSRLMPQPYRVVRSVKKRTARQFSRLMPQPYRVMRSSVKSASKRGGRVTATRFKRSIKTNSWGLGRMMNVKRKTLGFRGFYKRLRKKKRPSPRPRCVPTGCKIELFSRTLFRGDIVSITNNTPDLKDFDDKLQSLRVSGNCRWTVYTEKKYGGVEQTFRTGEYKNAIKIRNVLMAASSVRNIGC